MAVCVAIASPPFGEGVMKARVPEPQAVLGLLSPVFIQGVPYSKYYPSGVSGWKLNILAALHVNLDSAETHLFPFQLPIETGKKPDSHYPVNQCLGQPIEPLAGE